MNPKKLALLTTPFIVLFVVFGLLFLRTRVPEPEVEAKKQTALDDTAFLADLAQSRTRGLKGIAVVAPASGLRDWNLERAPEVFNRAGLSFPKDAIDPARVPYNATDDATRLELFKQALNDPEVEVLWALRGGYGSSRLLAELANVPQPLNPKIFVGYSDMTFLHLFLQREWGWRTVHGAMAWEMASAAKDPENFRLLGALLAGTIKELRYGGLRPFNKAATETTGRLEAPITGGNLTCLAAAIGTPWPPAAAGKILFIEDVDEKGYKLDRMLTQLRLAGELSDVVAVIVGSFTEGDEHLEYALTRFAEEFDKPVFRTDQFGHGEKNYPLIFNTPAVIEKDENAPDSFSLRIAVDKLP